MLDQQVQALEQAAFMGNARDCLAVAYRTGLHTLGKAGAGQGGTAQLFHILGTELDAHLWAYI